jgi:hypothetical protein
MRGSAVYAGEQHTLIPPDIVAHVTHTMQGQLARAGNATGLIVVSPLLRPPSYREDRLPDSIHLITGPRTITPKQFIGHRSVALADRIDPQPSKLWRHGWVLA